MTDPLRMHGPDPDLAGTTSRLEAESRRLRAEPDEGFERRIGCASAGALTAQSQPEGQADSDRRLFVPVRWMSQLALAAGLVLACGAIVVVTLRLSATQPGAGAEELTEAAALERDLDLWLDAITAESTVVSLPDDTMLLIQSLEHSLDEPLPLRLDAIDQEAM